MQPERFRQNSSPFLFNTPAKEGGASLAPKDSPQVVIFHEAQRVTAARAKGALPPTQAPLARRAVQVPQGAETSLSQLEAAVALIDEAHARLKAQLDARGGQVQFAQPSRGASRRGVNTPLLDAEAPEVLRNLTVLRKQVHNALRLAEPHGMDSVTERAERAQKLAHQKVLLKRAFQRWDVSFPETFNEVGAASGLDERLPRRASQGRSGVAQQALYWPEVNAASKWVVDALQETLKERADSLEESQVHHPFYLPRMLETQALIWDAAAGTLEALRGKRDLKSYPVQVLPTRRALFKVATLEDDGKPVDWHEVRQAARQAVSHEGKHGLVLATPAREDAISTDGTRATNSPSRSALSQASSEGLASATVSTASLPSTSSQSTSASPSDALFASPSPAVTSSSEALSSSPSPLSLDAAEKPPVAQEGPGDLFDEFGKSFRWQRDAMLNLARQPGSRKLASPEEVLGLQLHPPGRLGKLMRRVLPKAFFPPAPPPIAPHLPDRKTAVRLIRQAMSEARNSKEGRPPSSSGAVAFVRNWWRDKVTTQEIEKTFDRVYSQLLSRRPNEVIKSRVLVPVAHPMDAAQPGASGGSARAGRWRAVSAPLVLQCEQRPAIAVSDALHNAYAQDGVQGANCHERTQHKHAVNLYVSDMKSADGRAHLRLIRHGVLSANQLTKAGIKKLSDADLCRVAFDLAGDLAKPPLNDKRVWGLLRNETPDGSVPAVAAKIRGKPLTPESALLRTSAYLQEPAPRRGEKSEPALPPLIDQIRRAASLRRAREAAETALASLPDEEITRLVLASQRREEADRTGRGGPPATVRLASVSLMTPDVWRSSYKSNERSMWHDQRQAWADLASQKEHSMPMPRLDADNKPLRDAAGRLIMARADEGNATAPQLKVRFEVAALNVPVNKWGTRGSPVEFFVRGHAEADLDNRAAMERLLGSTPQAWASCGEDKVPTGLSGWLGERLRSDAVPAEEKRVLRDLAAQIGKIYTGGKHQSGGSDPYKLATRLIVLASRLGGSTATLINCKSGKDRTSAAETEARRMTLEIATTGKVPDLNVPVTPLLSRQLGAIHESGGSREVQTWNTGMAGTKLDHPGLFERYGLLDQGQKDALLGLSKFTKS